MNGSKSVAGKHLNPSSIGSALSTLSFELSTRRSMTSFGMDLSTKTLLRTNVKSGFPADRKGPGLQYQDNRYHFYVGSYLRDFRAALDSVESELFPCLLASQTIVGTIIPLGTRKVAGLRWNRIYIADSERPEAPPITLSIRSKSSLKTAAGQLTGGSNPSPSATS